MRPFNLIGLFFLAASFSYAAPPTFGDLAVFTAKGYLAGQVRRDASLEQCVAFLNRQGICFSLFDLLDPSKAVTQEDLARVIGQSTRLFAGDPNVVDGCIQNPEGITWIDYCLLNDISVSDEWARLNLYTAGSSVPEVRKWLGQ